MVANVGCGGDFWGSGGELNEGKPRHETVQTSLKMVAVKTTLSERHGVVEQGDAVLEPRRHRFGDKDAQESTQTELSLVKTAAVIGDDLAFDSMEAFQTAQTGRGRRFTQAGKNDNFLEGERLFREKQGGVQLIQRSRQTYSVSTTGKIGQYQLRSTRRRSSRRRRNNPRPRKWHIEEVNTRVCLLERLRHDH